MENRSQIGFNAGSNGTVTVDGPGSRWTNFSLLLGNRGSGSLNITTGGEVSSVYGSIGGRVGTNSTVTVTGAGSQWTNSGDLYVGPGSSAGTGLLDINTGGTVSVGGLNIWITSTVNLNGGTLSAGAITLNGGSFDFTSGQLNLTNSDLAIGTGGLLGNNVALGANRQVSVSGILDVLSGATLSLNGGTLTVGDTLAIAQGGTVTGQGTLNGGLVAVAGDLNLTGNSEVHGNVLIGDIFGGTGHIGIADGTATNFYGDVFAGGTGISVGAGGEAVYHGVVGGGGCSGTPPQPVRLTGAGTHRAADGTVSPGCSPGLLTVENDFVFESAATFLVEINGLARGTNPGYDAMDIGDDAWLAGILDVDLLDGFAPNAGDSFDILTAMVLHGTFDSTILPALGSGLHWELRYLLNPNGLDTVQLAASAVPVPAAVWLFGSGLGVLTLLRRRSTPARATLH